MRVLLSLLMFVAVLVSARAQSPAQPQPSPDPQGTSEEIGIDDLQSTIITFDIGFTGHTRWSGDNIVRPMQFKQRFKVYIGPGGSISWTTDENGRVSGSWYSGPELHLSYSALIGRTDTKPEKFGKRAIVWTLEGNILTYLRVFERGGKIVKIMLSRSDSSLGCAVTSAYLQEVGVGNPMIKAGRQKQGGYREYIGMKQTSSTCRVSKK